MSKWQQKLLNGEYQQTTLKTVKSPDSRVIADFLLLVRATGVCDYQLLIEDELILAELDADDLRELQTSDRQERRNWAHLLAHRLCMERLEKGPPRPGERRGKAAGATTK